MGWLANIVFLLLSAFKRASAPSAAATFLVSICLGLSGPSAASESCRNHPFAAEPCPGVAEKWQSFLELQDLHASLAAARSLEAFLAGHDEEAMHYLALARGSSPESALPKGHFGSLEMARVQRRRQTGCTADPYASSPCLGVAGAWQSYARERRVIAGWESSRDFVSELNERATGSQPSARDDPGTKVPESEAPSRPGGGLIIRVYPGSGFEGS